MTTLSPEPITDKTMRNVFKMIPGTALTAALLSACSWSGPVQSGDLTLEVNDSMKVTLTASQAARPLVKADAPFSELLADGAQFDYVKTGMERSRVNDAFGEGVRYLVSGEASDGEHHVLKEMEFFVYDSFPSTVISKVTYTNLSDTPLEVSGWTSDDFTVITEDSEPALWSFQGQSTSARADWLIPITGGFYQKNYMGMNSSDYGGGVPVDVLWRRDAGLIVGHLEPEPQQVSLPVRRNAGENLAEVSVLKEFSPSLTLAKGQKVETCLTFVGTFKGDCFSPLRNYSAMLEKVGVVMPESEPSAFEPAWCAWGYARKFTIDEIIGTLPKVKELGFKWATLDDGYQIAEGDWDLTKERFPRGDEDMKYMVDKFHEYGLKAELWWAPLAADPGTEFLKKYPDALILDKDGSPEYITWWDSWYLSPLDTNVRRETASLVRKFMDEYGFDGLKLDGQHMNAVAPDYNPAHHPDDPEKDVRELPGFFKLIYDTARDVKHDAVVQYCPCGDCFSVYNLPYTNKTVASDPTSSWQIRHKGYVLRALAPKTAYYGDHIELSDGRDDWPTQLGIGAVIGTKFTWPADNPYVKDNEKCLLTPEKEAEVKNAVAIYNDKMLSLGEYVPGLYDIGYDYPETHVISKDGSMYYAFYAKEQPVSSVELRGLEAGKTYRVTDYYNHRDLGTVTVTDTVVLDVPVDKYLLLEVSPE